MKKIFYGWIIVALSCLLLFAVIGVGHNCWSIFTIPMCEDLGMTRQQFSNFFTVMMCSEITALLTINKLFTKFGQLNIMRIAAFCLPLSILGISRINSFWGFYAFAIILGYGIIADSFYAISLILANWFIDEKGMAMGIVFMSSPFGSMILLPFVNKWIVSFGWRMALVILAAIMASLTISITWFGLKEKPEDLGLLPFRKEKNNKVNIQNSETLWGVNRKELLKLPGGWFMIFAILTNYMTCTCTNTIVPYLCDIGYSSSAATTIDSIALGIIALGRFIGGKLSDRFGAEKVMQCGYLIAPFVLVGLILIPYGKIFIPLMLIGFSFSQFCNTVCLPMVTANLFGRKHYASVHGLFSAIGTSMGAFYPLIYGMVYTKKGSYLPTYKAFVIGGFLASILLFLAIKNQKKYKKEKRIE